MIYRKGGKYDKKDNLLYRIFIHVIFFKVYILTGLNPDNEKWVLSSALTSTGEGGLPEGGGCNGSWLPRYELEAADIQEDRIKGKKTFSVRGGTVIVDFDYELP